jgi:hypothetical protein
MLLGLSCPYLVCFIVKLICGFATRYEGDVEEFLSRSAKVHQGKVNIIHSSFDPVEICVSGNRATSEAFCLVTSSLTLGGVDYELASHMRLASRLEKSSEAGQWRMLSLESIYVRDRLVTAFPASNATSPLIMSDDVLAYPKSYRHLALVMLNRGLKPRPDLPHEDDQEGVRRVLDGNRAYLDGAEEEITKD